MEKKKQLSNIIDILSMPSLVLDDSSILLHPKKNGVLNDKSNLLDTLSSQKLVNPSTPNTDVFAHFYNEDSFDMFKKLWVPPQINFKKLDLFFLNGSSINSTVSHKIFTDPNIQSVNKNYLNTCFKILRSSQQNNVKVKKPIMESKEKNNDHVIKKTAKGLKEKNPDRIIRCRKIRFFPNKDYIDFFNKCFGTTRYLYNQTIYRFKQEIQKKQDEFRQLAINSGCIKMVSVRPPKSKKIPKKKSKKASSAPIVAGSKTSNKKPKVLPSKQCCGTLVGDYFCEKHSECTPKYGIKTDFIYWRNKMIPKIKIFLIMKNGLPKSHMIQEHSLLKILWVALNLLLLT